MYSACPDLLNSHAPTDSLLLNMLEDRRSGLHKNETVQSRIPVVELSRGRCGEIINVKIGRWRVLSSDVHRRIVDVRELDGQRVAVRIELDNQNRLASHCSHCTIWELYDCHGHLLSMLQDMGDRKIWLTTGFRRKQSV